MFWFTESFFFFFIYFLFSVPYFAFAAKVCLYLFLLKEHYTAYPYIVLIYFVF